MINPNQPHWTVYISPLVDEPEAECSFVETSPNWNYIWARACHQKLIYNNKRVFIRWTPVKPFDQDTRFQQDVCHLEVLSLFSQLLPGEDGHVIDIFEGKGYPF